MIEVKKAIFIDNKPFVSAKAAASHMSWIVATRMATKIYLAEQAKGNFQSMIYERYSVPLPSPEAVKKVGAYRKRAYNKFKARLEKYLLD